MAKLHFPCWPPFVSMVGQVRAPRQQTKRFLHYHCGRRSLSFVSIFALASVNFPLANTVFNNLLVGTTKANIEVRERSPEVHMLAIADADFARKYHPIFEKNEQYARRHGYKWHLIGEESANCTTSHADYYFFRKHCMVAQWMEGTPDDNDLVFVFDADVVPYRYNISLQNWMSTIPEDVVMYEWIWNTEIMAGNYMVRNNHRARHFLKEWSRYEYEKPGGNAFSSSDNGAIHLHIRRLVGLEELKNGHCGQMYRNLMAGVDNLDPYYEFVACARQNVTPGMMEAADRSGLTLRLLGKAKAWVVDGGFDPLKHDEFGPVFHHGVKMPFNRENIEKYKLNVSQMENEDEADEVSCGLHSARNCTMCILNQEGELVGKPWCNGDCIWKEPHDLGGDFGMHEGSCVPFNRENIEKYKQYLLLRFNSAAGFFQMG